MKAYMKFINNIIKNYGQYGEKRSETEKKTLEKHHIKPAVLGGDDSESNMIYLTPAEYQESRYLMAKFLIESGANLEQN